MNASNITLDLRVRRTYKFLWDALMSLMTERDFESVSVTDICERAMVHRTTFYKHYEDKYGLLYQGIQDELNALFEALDSVVDKPLEMDDEADSRARVIAVFEHILRHERFYRLMLCGNGVGKFYTLLIKALAQRFQKRSETHFRKEGTHASLRNTLLAQSHAGVLVSAVAWWLDNDCALTPVEMGEFVWDDTLVSSFKAVPKG